MEKTGFKDRIAVNQKERRPPAAPKNGKNSPWDYRAPCYDERTSCFVNAGTHYGVGHKQPVGHEGNPSSEGVPMGRVKTLELYKNG